MTTTTTRVAKTHDQHVQEAAEARARALDAFGDLSVEDVLFRVRTRLTLVSELCMAQSEADGEMSVEGWAGLDHSIEDIKKDVKMLEAVLPVDVTAWRPGQR